MMSIRNDDPILPRLETLRASAATSDLDEAERAALEYLHDLGCETIQGECAYRGPQKSIAIAATHIAFAAAGAREGYWDAVSRTLERVANAVGLNGGPLPTELHRARVAIQFALEDRLSLEKVNAHASQ
jgi:hypothetical protein